MANHIHGFAGNKLGLSFVTYRFSALILLIQVLNKNSAAAEMGNHLATIDMDRKLVGGCAPFWGSWVSI